MARISGKGYREILLELQGVGMRSLPGGGAEILDDQIRKRVSPKKISGTEWIKIMEVAHSIGLSTTSTMVFGFGESIVNRLKHFSMLRDAQDRSLESGYQGFCAFICWPLQSNENTSLGRSKNRDSYGASATEYLRMVALARIFLDNIPNHQASWPTLGIDTASIALHFGCNDIGSTMMEENVVSQAGGPSSECWSMSPSELQTAICDAGYTAAQRDSAFNILKTFPNKFTASAVA